MTEDREINLFLTRDEFASLAGLVAVAAKHLGLEAVTKDVLTLKEKMETIANEIMASKKD